MLDDVGGIDLFEGVVAEALKVPGVGHVIDVRAGIRVEDLPARRPDLTPDVQFPPHEETKAPVG
jgi:hypothetical protein